jgi:photosystem II stability/assembly factor-like uncharacterized protein
MNFKKALILIITVLSLGGMFSSGFGSAGSIDSEPLSPAIPAAVLFSDDFESGSQNWALDGNWNVVTDGSHVLDGQGPAWATLKRSPSWTNYTVSAKVKLVNADGVAHIMVRMSEDRGRYIIGIRPGGTYLLREYPWGSISPELQFDNTPISVDSWYQVEINVNLSTIQVSVNGSQRINYKDLFATSLWQGSIGLEVAGSEFSKARFDDVLVTGVQPAGGTWYKTGGPIGGLGYDVRYGSADEQTMFVTDNFSGVNKSVDGGQTWFASNNGITGRFGSSGDAVPVFSLTVDPNDWKNVWAGLKDVKGLFSSSDNGFSWIERTPNMSEAQFVFRGITVREENSNEVYAGGEIPTNIDGKTFGKVQGRVYRSMDGGNTWTPIWDGDDLTRYIILHPTDQKIIYVSAGIFDREAYNSNCDKDIINNLDNRGGVGVLRSKDGGVTWQELNRTNGLDDLYVGSLVMHPANPNILLAGTGNNACSVYSSGGQTVFTGGVFLTEDGGDNWNHTLKNDTITSVEFAPSDPKIAYAGGQHFFYRSEDGGKKWQVVAGESFPWGPPGVRAGFPIDILVDPNDPNTLFVNNYLGGNVKSTDGGKTWTLASTGYTGAEMHSVVVHPDQPGNVYGTSRSGIFRSNDGGEDWFGLVYSPMNVFGIFDAVINPDNPRVVIASDELSPDIYRSENGGQTWVRVHDMTVGTSSDQHGFKSLVMAPSNSQIIYGGICRSSTTLSTTKNDSFGVYKSTDGGKNWVEANDTDTGDKCINALAVHPHKPNTVYAATVSGGLYKTEDSGASWTQLVGLLPKDIRAIAIKPDNPDVVYAGVQYGGFYRSEDGGGQWTAMMAGMESNDAIWSIVFDPNNPEIIWVGSIATGVYKWDPAQAIWQHINDGLRTRAVHDLAFSSDGSVLYAATSGEGVFRLGEVTVSDYSVVFIPLALR